MAVDEICRHSTGQLACRRATHAVGDHEERTPRADLVATNFRLQACVACAQVGNEKGVLIVLAGAPEIGLAEDGDAHGALLHGHLEWVVLQRSSSRERPAAAGRVTRRSLPPLRAVRGLTNLGSREGSVNAVLA